MTVASLIVWVREQGADTASSNTQWQELVGTGDGSNKYFRARRTPIVTGSFYLTFSTNFRQVPGTAYTLDLTTGILTFGTAPVLGLKLNADYNYYFFSDSVHTDFLSRAARMLQVGATDPTTIVDGLLPALIQYALFHYYQARATQYALLYPSSGGGVGQSADTRTKDMMTLAADAKKNGDAIRDDYYKRQGEKIAPASQDAHYGFDPITPMR